MNVSQPSACQPPPCQANAQATSQPVNRPAMQGTSQPPAQTPDAEEAALFEQLFNVTDEDKSGSASMQEFGDLLQYAQQQSGAANSRPLNPAVVEQVFNQADSSGDGSLSEQEFNQFVGQAMAIGEQTQSQGPASAPVSGAASAPMTPPAPINNVPVVPVEEQKTKGHFQ